MRLDQASYLTFWKPPRFCALNKLSLRMRFRHPITPPMRAPLTIDQDFPDPNWAAGFLTYRLTNSMV